LPPCSGSGSHQTGCRIFARVNLPAPCCLCVAWPLLSLFIKLPQQPRAHGSPGKDPGQAVFTLAASSSMPNRLGNQLVSYCATKPAQNENHRPRKRHGTKHCRRKNPAARVLHRQPKDALCIGNEAAETQDRSKARITSGERNPPLSNRATNRKASCVSAMNPPEHKTETKSKAESKPPTCSTFFFLKFCFCWSWLLFVKPLIF